MSISDGFEDGMVWIREFASTKEVEEVDFSFM